MEFLVIARGKPNNSPSPDLGKAESQRVWEYYKTGKARLMYYFSDRKGAVMILNAENLEEAMSLAQALPMAEAGLIDLEVIELSPYTGLERLFV
jgi:hypothetical protein